MTLLECFDKHQCDKGSGKHRYDKVYEPILEPLRRQPLTLLEIGVLRGQSLSAWLEYFPSARVIGVDTFGRVPAEAVPVLSDPRVTWFACDSTKTAPKVTADIIIDDGYHTPEAQLETFNNYWPLLNGDGIYFIEDADPSKTVEYGALLEALNPYRVNVNKPKAPNGSYLIEVRHGR
jgi:hypothetical protein